MKEINFEFSVASDVDYENLIVDIGFDNKLIALLTQEEGFDKIRIKIFSPTEGEYWNFSLSEFEEIIQKAKNRLWELRKIE
jgi:hypothetical protein